MSSSSHYHYNHFHILYGKRGINYGGLVVRYGKVVGLIEECASTGPSSFSDVVVSAAATVVVSYIFGFLRSVAERKAAVSSTDLSILALNIDSDFDSASFIQDLDLISPQFQLFYKWIYFTGHPILSSLFFWFLKINLSSLFLFFGLQEPGWFILFLVFYKTYIYIVWCWTRIM